MLLCPPFPSVFPFPLGWVFHLGNAGIILPLKKNTLASGAHPVFYYLQGHAKIKFEAVTFNMTFQSDTLQLMIDMRVISGADKKSHLYHPRQLMKSECRKKKLRIISVWHIVCSIKRGQLSLCRSPKPWSTDWMLSSLRSQRTSFKGNFQQLCKPWGFIQRHFPLHARGCW